MADKKPAKPEEIIAENEATEAQAAEVTQAVETTAGTAEVKTAKAGKRSTKALKEADEKAEKEARKEGEAEAKEAPKVKIAATRTRLERRGKNYRKLATQIDTTKIYTLAEAVELAKKTNPVKFDASVEVHVNLGVDPRQADQNIRATVTLPHGTGKTIRIAVLAPADQHDKAKKAGADIVGEEDLLQLLDKEQLDFDVLIATPQLMPKLGKYARLLGPRGLMPNPKSGTVAANVAKAVEEAKAGRVEYRVDKQSIVHQAVGKVSFTEDQLVDNIKTLIDSLKSVKPASVKAAYIKNASLATTMGPGIKFDIHNV